MANESTAAGQPPANPPPGTPSASLAPAERTRIAQCFQRGTQAVATNADYAVDMFSICVVSDPGNSVYVQSLLGVLRKKFAGRKSGGLTSLFGSGARALRKLAASAQWRELIKQGVETLKGSPGDHGVLLAMADACGNLGFADAQRTYLKAALDAAPADAEVNRQCAKFLAEVGEFDQAIACWVRVSKVKGLAEEAEKAISELQVDKTINAGQGMIGRGSPGKAVATVTEQPAAVDRIAELTQAVESRPTEIEPYLELADLLERDGRVDEAERILERALAASGNDLKVREHVEDRQLRWARHKVHVAEKRLAAEESPAHRELVERLRAALLKQEIDVYAARTARYPENVGWKYELAMRLKAAGNHAEAIRHFQDALQDSRRRGVVSLELGECFQKIKQYQLAMQNYQAAVETLTERELDLRKRALYRAGVLATGLQDVDGARKFLAALASLDFGYRDVAQRLDKLGPGKDKGSAD